MPDKNELDGFERALVLGTTPPNHARQGDERLRYCYFTGLR
jgi:hypothetical protein